MSSRLGRTISISGRAWRQRVAAGRAAPRVVACGFDDAPIRPAAFASSGRMPASCRSVASVPSATLRPRLITTTRSTWPSSSARACDEIRTHGAVVAQSAHDRVEILSCRRIQSGCRLVEQQRARVAEQRLGETEPLAHALGIGADATAADRGEADAVQQVRNHARRLALQARIERQRLDRPSSTAGTRRSPAGSRVRRAREPRRCRPDRRPARARCRRSAGTGPASA